jgi:hypothetical protein
MKNTLSGLLVLSVCVYGALISFGCSQKPSERIIGKWYGNDTISTLEFLDDQTVNIAVGNYLRTDGKGIEEVLQYISRQNWSIELGFLVIPFASLDSRTVSYDNGDDKASLSALVKFNTPPDEFNKYAKVTFSTDEYGEARVIDEWEGEAVRGFQALGEKGIPASLLLEDEELAVEGVMYDPEYIDLNWRWNGTITARASYRFTGKTNFEIFVPVTSGDPGAEVILLEGSIANDRLLLGRQSLTMGKDLAFVKSRPKALAPTGAILDTSDQKGMLITTINMDQSEISMIMIGVVQGTE